MGCESRAGLLESLITVCLCRPVVVLKRHIHLPSGRVDVVCVGLFSICALSPVFDDGERCPSGIQRQHHGDGP